MSLILFIFCSASFYWGFKCGHKYADLKALKDGLVNNIKRWTGQVIK